MTVVRYPKILMQYAQRLFDNGEFGVAVAVAPLPASGCSRVISSIVRSK